MSKYKNPIRLITAASLFDGHDASIGIMRRILQDSGAEVIHLGHNRSVQDVVTAAIQEDAQGICVSSYQGGHMEYFKYMIDLLRERGCGHIKVFGGGGGVIVFDEKRELEAYGVARIYHPEDGRRLGLQGMIDDILSQCDFSTLEKTSYKKSPAFKDWTHLGQDITFLEQSKETVASTKPAARAPKIIGLTGSGGAGKSSLTDELVQRFLNVFPKLKICILSVDPTKRKTGGALLGDRIRMNSISRGGVFMRSLATRDSGSEISKSLKEVINLCQTADFDLILAETVGIGQSGSAIQDLVDISLYVMTSEFGAPTQLEKIDMLDYADFIAINKFDRRGSEDALREVRKQYKRSRKLFEALIGKIKGMFLGI